MKITLKKELPILLTLAIPFIYLRYKWNLLPKEVPVHWNLYGEADNWSDKNGLLLMISALLLSSYFIWLVLSVAVRQKWVQQMGEKFYHLRFIFSVFFSIICLYIIQSAIEEATDLNFVTLLIGGLIAMVGNYISSLKPNYFLGVRTPWTLKSELVWKRTHRFSSRLMLVSGLLIVLLSLFRRQNSFILFLIIVFIMVTASVIYSYVAYQQLQEK